MVKHTRTDTLHLDLGKNKMMRFGLLLMIASTLAGCAELGGKSWREEAMQPDGKKIVVTRKTSHKGRHELGQRPPIGYQSLTFTIPETGERVEWEDTYSEDIGSANFNPMFLGVLNDKAYVLSSPAGCLSYNKWGRPNPPYVVFKYEDKDWKRIPLQDLPVSMVKPNLIISSPDTEVEKSRRQYITAGLVDYMNEGFGRPEYRTILREALAYGNGCEELYSDGKGGWLGVGWFKHSTQEECTQFCAQKNISAEFCKCIISK